MTLTEMKRRRAELRAQLQTIHTTAEGENRNLNPAEQADWDRVSGEVRDLDARIQRAEAFEHQSRSLAESEANADPETTDDPFLRDLATRPYSLLRMAERALRKQPFDGWEGEVSAELAKRSGKKPQGLLVPMILPIDQRAALRAAALARVQTRDLTTTTGAGAVQVNTPPTIIEMLRARTVLGAAGATILSDLSGKLSLPKQTAGTAYSWVQEGNAPSAGNAQIGAITMQPRTISARTVITRAMMQQTSADVEAFARMDLTKALAVGIDEAGLAGPVAGPQVGPLGLLFNSNITLALGSGGLGTNGGALTWAGVVAMETTVANANADRGRMAYITNSKVRGHAKTTVKVASYPVYLMSDDGSVNGYPTFITNVVPSNLTKAAGTNLSGALFGNWEDMLLGMWGFLDLLMDPYTSGGSGGVNIYALQDVDIVTRYNESFSRLNDIAA